MATRSLNRFSFLNEQTVHMLAKVGIHTANDFLLASPLALMSALNMNLSKIQEITQLLSEKLLPNTLTALELYDLRSKQTRFIKTGIFDLDKCLKGGLLLGTITDICGVPGSGKTQFCMSCIIDSISSHQQADELSSIIYFDAEQKFDPIRFTQIAVERFPELYSTQYRLDAPHLLDDLLKRVKIFRPNTLDDFNKLFQDLETMILTHKSKLVIIDSLAIILQKEGKNEKDRDEIILNHTSILKSVAEACNCAILATNQVHPIRSNAHAEQWLEETIIDQGIEYIPTLGPTWLHCVTTRLLLIRNPTKGTNNKQQFINSQDISQIYEDIETHDGLLIIAKSPFVAKQTLKFRIQNQGVHAILSPTN